MPHEVYISPNKNSQGASWNFNGDVEKPTFSPSIVVVLKYGDPSRPARRCHSFVREGLIEFLGGCTHSLKGKTVGLGEFDG